ncbi:MAG: LamB/YcsF family protein [Sphingobacteriales bacterium]|nr:MAG: LamB/YcsF family protein [Sphingobacteriales bacterium]
MLTVDLNCDMGEALGIYPMPNDDILMDHISSANIACGFHAGGPEIMEYTVRSAIKKGVAIGAHPGLPDLENFGRLEMKVSPAEAYQMTFYQVGTLNGFVKAADGKLHHVKPHGALYNMAARDAALAKAIADAVHDFDPSLILYALAGSQMIFAAEAIGLRTASEVFADRTYQDDGSLTPRSQAGALINDEEKAINQVLQMINQQQVISLNNKIIPLKAETICLHSDGVNAIGFARLIHGKLKSEGIEIKAP